ncbi:MAG TPA: cyclic nucleotide-binding domain-containing protein [Actinomycetota bacterium]
MDDTAVGIAALEAVPVFAGVTRHDLQNILKLGDVRSFEPGQAIVERGEPGDALYVILRGTAQVDVGGRYHDMKQGEFFGEMGVIAGKKRMATVKAAERVDALRIGAKEVENFLLHQPQVALAMMRSLVERLREVQERIDAWAGVW